MEVLSLLLSLKYSRKTSSRVKISALDWERRTERRHSARFQDASRRSGGGLGRLTRSPGAEFDRDTLVQLLKQRQDISSEEADQIIAQLESTRDSVTTAQELQDAAQSKAQELRGR